MQSSAGGGSIIAPDRALSTIEPRGRVNPLRAAILTFFFAACPFFIPLIFRSGRSMPVGPQINAVWFEKAENGRRQMAIFANVRGPNKAAFEVFRCYRELCQLQGI